jgi:hypothetical protein
MDLDARILSSTRVKDGEALKPGGAA